uniref:Spermatogenesis associated 6 n=1 Tax=Erpetoichthys calabaricus TaxID=27687 RepID=A0A8C4S953_ERPCA
MAPKVLKCTVELEIQAVTCPGVVLMNKEDVYLSVCILGKYLKTKCLPPVFPMVFREKMIFHKVFGEAVDPGHVAELLELDTATFELIQLIPPVGETLAVLAENTREFLYPGPRLSPSYVGSNRDLLMKRAISFPGIAPKLEFSTFSAIEECSLQEGDAMMMRRVPPSKLETPKRTKKGPSEERRWARGYELPTVSSQSRSPSPYTRRRMCELSEESRERLAHLNLGPYRFKKETETHAPFVVRHVDDKQRSLMDDSQLSFRLSSPKSNLCHSWSSGFRVGEDSSLLGSYRPKTATVIRKPQETDSPNTSFDTFDEHISMSASRLMQSGRLASVHSAPSSVQKHPPSPLLHRSSLKERTMTRTPCKPPLVKTLCVKAGWWATAPGFSMTPWSTSAPVTSGPIRRHGTRGCHTEPCLRRAWRRFMGTFTRRRPAAPRVVDRTAASSTTCPAHLTCSSILHWPGGPKSTILNLHSGLCPSHPSVDLGSARCVLGRWRRSCWFVIEGTLGFYVHPT